MLTPTVRHAERALRAGARHICFVLSVSERHNQSNVRRSPSESVAEYKHLVELLPAGVKLRLNLATAFDCPFAGRMAIRNTLQLLETLAGVASTAEIGLCDTTGRVLPDHVEKLFRACRRRFPAIESWAFHAHDTYGMGAANVLAAWRAGVTVVDASIAGLGGCPFAPGASGNVATEDVAWMFEGMGVRTGLDILSLVEVAQHIGSVPGGQTGGRVRDALSAATGTT